MRIIPEFGPGEISGGWFTLIYLASNVIPIAFFRKGAAKRLTARPANLSPSMRRYVWLQTQLFFVPMAYAAWLPVRPGSVAFAVGALIFAVGIVAYMVAMVNFGRASLDGPICSGMYRFSRHPHYVSSAIAWLGASIAMTSIVIPLIWAVLFTMMHRTNRIEEEECVAQYGDAYRAYMLRVPRYFGIVNSHPPCPPSKGE